MKSANEILREAVNTFEKKDKEYGSNWKEVGVVLDSLFPKGIILDGIDDFTRFQFIFMIAGKLTRYTNNFKNGGHQDSIRDLCVYAAMLEACDLGIKEHDKFENEIDKKLEDEIYQAKLKEKGYNHIEYPKCYKSNPAPSQRTENKCYECKHSEKCLEGEF